MATATSQDVESRLGRPLDESEVALAETLLGDVELLIKSKARNFDALDPDIVVMVEATAVARVLRNPDGIRSQSADEFSYTVDSRVASGYLNLLPDEWALLGIGRGYASIPMKFRRR